MTDVGQGPIYDEAGEEIWIIEAIKGHDVRDGRLHFLIKWQNWGDENNTWEPIENLLGYVDEHLSLYMNNLMTIVRKSNPTNTSRPGNKSGTQLPAPEKPKIVSDKIDGGVTWMNVHEPSKNSYQWVTRNAIDESTLAEYIVRLYNEIKGVTSNKTHLPHISTESPVTANPSSPRMQQNHRSNDGISSSINDDLPPPLHKSLSTGTNNTKSETHLNRTNSVISNTTVRERPKQSGHKGESPPKKPKKKNSTLTPDDELDEPMLKKQMRVQMNTTNSREERRKYEFRPELMSNEKVLDGQRGRDPLTTNVKAPSDNFIFLPIEGGLTSLVSDEKKGPKSKEPNHQKQPKSGGVPDPRSTLGNKSGQQPPSPQISYPKTQPPPQSPLNSQFDRKKSVENDSGSKALPPKSPLGKIATVNASSVQPNGNTDNNQPSGGGLPSQRKDISKMVDEDDEPYMPKDYYDEAELAALEENRRRREAREGIKHRGSFLRDIPLEINNVLFDVNGTNELFFEIRWKPRLNGEQMKNSWVSLNELSYRSPDLFLKFFLWKLKSHPAFQDLLVFMCMKDTADKMKRKFISPKPKPSST